MRYALFVMLLACGDKEEDTAAVEEEVQVEETDTATEESEESEESEEGETDTATEETEEGEE